MIRITIEESSFKIYRILKEKKFDLSLSMDPPRFLDPITRIEAWRGKKKLTRSRARNETKGRGVFACFRELCYFIYIFVDGSSRGPLPLPFTFMFYGQAVPRAPQKPTNSPTNAVALERNHFARFIYVVTIKRAPPSSNPWK